MHLVNYQSITISAPGSLMLLGEHAVCYRKPALVAAVNRRINVCLTPRKDKEIHIYSREFGDHVTSLSTLAIVAPYEYVLSAILQLRKELKLGFNLEIRTDFSAQLGLGSSAAVTVATVAAILQWLTNQIDLFNCYQKAAAAIKKIFSKASAADVVASIVGGVVFYQPPQWQLITTKLPLTVIYTGCKEPTKKIVTAVAERYQQETQQYENYFTKMEDSIYAAVQAIKNKNYELLGQLFMFNHQIFQKMQLSNPPIDELIIMLNREKNLTGAKLSGSGLGDCVIAVGDLPENTFPKNTAQREAGIQQLSVVVTPQGVKYEAD